MVIRSEQDGYGYRGISGEGWDWIESYGEFGRAVAGEEVIMETLDVEEGGCSKVNIRFLTRA